MKYKGCLFMELFLSQLYMNSLLILLFQNGKHDKCNINDLEYSSFKSIEDINDAISINNKTRPCQKWTYDTSFYPRTIITDVSNLI